MKTILVGVDFTKSSEHTINYAVALAKQSESKLLLFHGLMAPVVHTTSGMVFVEGETELKDSEKRMKTLQQELQKNNPTIKVDYELTYDNIRERVKKLASKNKISLAVLGIESKSAFAKFIGGTTSADIAGKIDCPIITIPERFKFDGLKKVIVSIDNKETVSSGLSKRIHSLLKSLGAVPEFVHVVTEDELHLHEKNKHPFPITNIESKDFNTGISNYAKKTNADAILLISHNYSLFHSLFIESNSKRLILSSKTPVISIHK